MSDDDGGKDAFTGFEHESCDANDGTRVDRANTDFYIPKVMILLKRYEAYLDRLTFNSKSYFK